MRRFKLIKDTAAACCLTSDDMPKEYSRHLLKEGSVLIYIDGFAFKSCFNETTYYFKDLDNLREIK